MVDDMVIFARVFDLLKWLLPEVGALSPGPIAPPSRNG